MEDIARCCSKYVLVINANDPTIPSSRERFRNSASTAASLRQAALRLISDGTKTQHEHAAAAKNTNISNQFRSHADLRGTIEPDVHLMYRNCNHRHWLKARNVYVGVRKCVNVVGSSMQEASGPFLEGCLKGLNSDGNKFRVVGVVETSRDVSTYR